MRLIDSQLQRDAGLAHGEYATIPEAPARHIRFGEISDALGWEKSRASHLMGRMEQRGLIGREVCAEDARAIQIVVTPKGRRKQLNAIRGHVAEVRGNYIHPAQR